jgi:hypothetical protein
MSGQLLFLRFALSFICLGLCCSPALASAQEEAEAAPALLSTELPQRIDNAKETQASKSSQDALSAQALEVAKITGILPLYQRLRIEQKNAKRTYKIVPLSKSVDSNLPSHEGKWSHAFNQEDMLEAIFTNQTITSLRTQIGEYLQTANLEVNSVLGRLNSAMAGLADSKALIADERARILRRNSFINLISGGLTKIGGYSSALTPASPIPTNVLEVFDGGIQTSLSVLTLREQRRESKFYKSKQDILTSFITSENQPDRDYPESVWTYLNQRDLTSKSNKTRRDVLIQYWLTSGRLSGANGSKHAPGGQFTPTVARISKMDDIDDSVAMMSDLKSAVSEMESSLMQLSQVIKESYKSDPDF